MPSGDFSALSRGRQGGTALSMVVGVCQRLSHQLARMWTSADGPVLGGSRTLRRWRMWAIGDRLGLGHSSLLFCFLTGCTVTSYFTFPAHGVFPKKMDFIFSHLLLVLLYNYIIFSFLSYLQSFPYDFPFTHFQFHDLFFFKKKLLLY